MLIKFGSCLESVSERVVQSEVLRKTMTHEDDGARHLLGVGQRPSPAKEGREEETFFESCCT